mmetsp:Transcript_16031/g.20958  ORF Transcript_16031/g.20958 Transcript_16031/m.20958 type:complete len:416 (-) Transcript_16031:779-2026(-)
MECSSIHSPKLIYQNVVFLLALLALFFGPDSITAFHISSSSSSSLTVNLVPGLKNDQRQKEVWSSFNPQQQHYRSHKSPHQRKTTTRRDSLLVVQDGPVLLGSFYMLMLSLQYACQPLLSKRYAPKSIVKGSFIFAQDMVRVFTSLALLLVTGSWNEAVTGWTWSSAWLAAGLPAFLYALQNYCALQAYQNLSPITFNVLNQTKTLSAALFCFFLMGQKQTLRQILALILLLVSGLVMESIIPLPFGGPKGQRTKEEEVEQRTRWMSGVVPVLIASLLSGVAGAFSQKSLQMCHRNSLLFSLELGFISALFSLSNLVIPWTPDGRLCREKGLTVGWTWATLAPIATNAAGGILVGLVTKYSGSVNKGFAVMQGMFLSGLLQNKFSTEDKSVTSAQWVGGFLAATAFSIYAISPVK